MDRDGQDAGPVRPKLPKLHLAYLKLQQARRRGNANRQGSTSAGVEAGDTGEGPGLKGKKNNNWRTGRHLKDTSENAGSNVVARVVGLSRDISRHDTPVYEVDEHELDAEELRLQAEMLRLRERHFLLAKRTEEVRARKEAGKALEGFQVEIRAELEEMMQNLEEEKLEKLKEADVFKRCVFRRGGLSKTCQCRLCASDVHRNVGFIPVTDTTHSLSPLLSSFSSHRDVQARINELEGVLNQLANKVNGVNTMYAVTVEEIRREFTDALARKKQLLDIEVQEKLADFSRSWTNSG